MNLEESNKRLDDAIEIAKFKRLVSTIENTIRGSLENITIQIPRQEPAQINVERQEMPPISVTVPDFPQIPTPQVNVTVPEIKLPDFPKITVPRPEVTVNFDTSKIKPPIVKIPPFEFPDFPTQMRVKLTDVDQKTPLPVLVMNPQSTSGGARGGKVVSIPLLIEVPKTGQAVIASTGVALQLANKEFTNGVLISALSTNTDNIMIGEDGVTNVDDGTGNGYILEPGNTASFAVMNLKRLWITGTAGDIISYVGT